MSPATSHDAWFRDLYCQRAGELTRYLRRRGTDHDDADDLVSAVFLDAWRHRDELLVRQPACQRAWLYETAINHQRNHWRSQERKNRFLSRCPLPEDHQDVAEVLAEAADLTDRRQKFAGALTLLSIADQEVITTSLHSESSTVLGQHLGITETSARQRLSRARRRLVAALALAGAAMPTFWSTLDQVDAWTAALLV